MHRLRCALFLAFILGWQGCVHEAGVPPPPVPPPWPHEASDLKSDPAVTWGRLENGLRYAILPHRIPQQRVSVYLLVQAGSYHERDGELGYAHYVEHLAFREMRGFPRDGMKQALARLGVASGAHVNASTSPFETNFFLNNLPSDDPEALTTGLAVMRGIADGVVFEPETVEIERGVIYSEQRSRSGMLARARPDEMEYLPPRAEPMRWSDLETVFPGTRLLARYPIGSERTLRAATAEKLRTFYDRWYRPERMILAVAGDVSPTEMEQRLRETFGTLAGRGRAPAEIALEAPKPVAGPSVPTYLEDSHAERAMRLRLGSVRRQATADTSARRREALARDAALTVLTRRLNRMAELEGAPFTSAEAGQFHIAPGYEMTLLRVVAPPAHWSEALAVVDHEVRRAGEGGITDVEWEIVTTRKKTEAAVRARQTAAQPSAELAAALAYSAARGVVFTTPEDDRRFAQEQLATLTVADGQAALATALPGGRLTASIYGPLEDEDRDRKRAAAALAANIGKPLAPYPAPARPKPFPFVDFGPVGKIIMHQHSDLLDADLITFANGVRLNVKRTDFEPGHVRADIQFGSGRLTEPAGQAGLAWRIFAWRLGGLRDLSRDDERAALSEVVGDTTLTVTSTRFVNEFAGDAGSLPLMLQATAAYFARPAFRESEWPRSLEMARSMLVSYESTASGVAQTLLPHLMFSGHPAHSPVETGEIASRTLDELKAWLGPQLQSSPLEITLVGDIELTPAIDAVARTFGALPARAATDFHAEQRKVTFPPKPFTATATFEGPQSVAVASLAWPVPEPLEKTQRRQGEILADVFAARLESKVRDELGETYSPSAVFAWSDNFSPPCEELFCTIEVAPERAEAIFTAAHEVAEKLAREGMSAEEFERGRRPRVREAEASLRNNAWWKDVLTTAQSIPDSAESGARAMDDYRAATLEQVNALAKRIFVSERECRLLVQPKRPETAAR